MRFAALASLVAAALAPSAYAATYHLSDNWVGSAFLSAFTHEAIADPTHGRVNYVDQATAVAKNLTYASGDTLILRADHTTTLSASGAGRNSVRIRSVKTYDTHVVVWVSFILTSAVWPVVLTSPPLSASMCATCPKAAVHGPLPGRPTKATGPTAAKSTSIEGVNDQSPNAMTLHTGANCAMPASRTMTGTATNNNCDVNTDGNSGCGVQAPSANSYGPSFNANGGGWYAMERTNSFVKVWFFPRNAGNVPNDVKAGPATINTDTWGEPTALFPNTSCDIGGHFDANNIIINLTFCGDWAGQASIYSSSGCPSTCVDYVNNNPGAFANAYWDIASVRVWQ
ncbi:glycoside hydrolase family 16 protein [Phanerochaete sordida]|uniref:Glycoside hydrolase family 16 protein n=1 Tax=Phanerochaete sordida TaxID=48140 RepID=A0A9P3G4T9_9APHY|nr:glycoside hydrolase family 16 protein [Phanerochaete sordida]